MPSASHLQRRRDELQVQYDLLSEKIRHLRADFAIETASASRFELEVQIKQAEAERDDVERQIGEIERELYKYIKIYICYSLQDGADKAERLYDELHAQQIEVWRYAHDLNLDRELAAEIEQSISQATHIVVCVTPGVNQPEGMVQRELSLALSKSRPIIPLLFPGGYRPLLIVNHPGIDFTDWNSGFATLLRYLNGHAITEVEPQNQRGIELNYLQSIGELYARWRELYTEMALRAQVKRQGVKVKSIAAALHLMDIRHNVFKTISHEFEENPSNIVTIETFAELLKAIQEYRRVALIGDPGSGKTTTLERLTYELANEAAKSESAPLPLYARLGAYTGNDLTSFFASFFDGLELRSYLPGRVILLLDGLNEMPLHLLAQVDEWLKYNPDVSVIVSCRKLDYLDRKLPLQRIDISPLDVTRIYNFIGNYFEDEDRELLFWSLCGHETRDAWLWLKHTNPDVTFADFWFGKTEHVHSYENEKSHMKAVQDMLREEGKLPGVLGLVSNPFLLIAVIQIFDAHGQPPPNRGALFDQFVTLLLENRGKIAIKPDRPWIDERIQRQAMAKLAYSMQAVGTGTSVDEEWALNILNATLPGHNASLLLYFSASAGILEKGKKMRFVHQLLQEYFAADEMAEDIRRGVPATKYWPSKRWWEQTGWEETALLLAGIRGNSTDIVRWLMPVQPTLAYRCATESGAACDEKVLRQLYEPETGARSSPLARAEWGRKIAEEGDHRPGVALRPDGLPDVAWCQVPAGKFKMGGDPDLEVLGIAWEGAEIDIPYIFWIAKYPTTYAHYEAFVKDGYGERKYWTDAGWRWKGSQKYPRLWKDPRYHIANHPVVGVTWYEAYAYTCWLNEKLHEVGLDIPELTDEWEIRLPMEAEWEKAARYPDGRKYPWGNEYIPGYANIDETYENAECGPHCLRRTTAVGIYPQGANPNGVLDLCGNVWEWCLSKWDVVYTEHRGVRGASWYNSKLFAPVAAHDCQDADLGVNDVSFRIVVCPLSSISQLPKAK